MASIATEPNGRRRLLFSDSSGKRRTVRLGRIQQRHAEAIKLKVEALLSAEIAGRPPDDETARWVAGLDDALYEKFVAVGLLPSRDATLLGPFIERYIASRSDLAAGTLKTFRQAQSWLLRYFDPSTPMRLITLGDAEDWRNFLITSGLAENTIRTHTKKMRHFCNAAIKRGLITSNPFNEIPATVRANPKRFYFVDRATIETVIAACPDHQWRIILALARYGGLRCPSEVLELRWTDIDWDRNRITVHDAKRRRNPDKAIRVIPLFPEVARWLLLAHEEAAPGAEYVITRYRDTNLNLRTQLLRIIRRAGLEPWPKLFQNLRSTRETELAEEFPMHVVCRWIGNSQPVAAEHYLQLTDEHFERAVRGAGESDELDDTRSPNGRGVAQNPAQHSAAERGIASQDVQGESSQPVVNTNDGDVSRKGAKGRKRREVPPRGVEPLLPR